MSGAVAVKTVTILVLNKMIAIYSGPGGITLFAHLQNLLAIVNQLPNDGINKGFIKLYHDTAEAERIRFLGQVLVINTLLLMLLLLVIVLFPDFFWKNFQPVLSQNFIYIFFVSAIGMIWYYTFLSYFQAIKKFGTYSIIVAITSILILLISSSVIYFQGFNSFVLTYLILQIVGFLVALFFFNRKGNYKYLVPPVSIDNTKLAPLSEYVLMAFSVLIFTFLTDFFVRNYAIDRFGITDTGYWQAVVRFSDYYKAFFISIVGAVFYAEVSARINEKNFIVAYLKKILQLIIPLLAAGLLLIYFLRNIILSILYNNNFLPAAEFFSYQLAGDFLALIAYLFIYILMAEKRTGAFILVQALSTTFYLILLFFMVDIYYLEGFVIAHFYRNIFFLLVVVFINRRLFA